VFRRWGVSFPPYQRRGGVKPTLRLVQIFSLPFGAPGTACNFVALLAASFSRRRRQGSMWATRRPVRLSLPFGISYVIIVIGIVIKLLNIINSLNTLNNVV